MQKFRAGLLVGLSVALSLSVAAPAFADTKSQPEQTKAQPVETKSLSGSILAARVAEADNDLDSAVTYYKRALAFDPTNVDIKQSLLLSLVALGRFDESLTYANELKTTPDSERLSRLALAIDAIRNKKFKDVEHLMMLTKSDDLDELLAGIVRAWAKQGDGDTAGAIRTLDTMNGPDWYGLFTTYHQGLIEAAAGEKDKAIETLSLGLDDVSAAAAAPGVYLRMAEAYVGLLAGEGRKPEALAALDKADEFAPGRLPLQALREEVNAGGKVEPIAADAAQGVSEILFNLGSALDRDDGEPLARFYLSLALAADPTNDLALMQQAEAAEQAKEPQRAVDFYARVPDASPFKRISELQMALNQADLGKQDEAVTLLKKLIADEPDDMRAYLGLGNVYAVKENFRDAAGVYDQAAERLKNPTKEDWNIFYQRGISYERLKEWPKAEPNFKKALELFPDQPQVLNYLGYSWIDQDINLDEGLNLIKKAVDQRPSDGYIVDSLGWAYYKLGRFPEAVTELERAVSLKPEDPVLNDHLGDAYWRAGRQLEATFQWRHAKDLKPEDPKVLAEVEKKLKEGLPPLPEKAASAQVTPAAPVVAPTPATPEQKTEAPAVPTPAAPAAATPPPGPVEAPKPAAAAHEPVAPAPTEASYLVKRGQSLWSIAVEQLGNGERYRELIKLNRQLRDPNIVQPGVQLRLPGT